MMQRRLSSRLTLLLVPLLLLCCCSPWTIVAQANDKNDHHHHHGVSSRQLRHLPKQDQQHVDDTTTIVTAPPDNLLDMEKDTIAPALKASTMQQRYLRVIPRPSSIDPSVGQSLIEKLKNKQTLEAGSNGGEEGGGGGNVIDSVTSSNEEEEEETGTGTGVITNMPPFQASGIRMSSTLDGINGLYTGGTSGACYKTQGGMGPCLTVGPLPIMVVTPAPVLVVTVTPPTPAPTDTRVAPGGGGEVVVDSHQPTTVPSETPSNMPSETPSASPITAAPVTATNTNSRNDDIRRALIDTLDWLDGTLDIAETPQNLAFQWITNLDGADMDPADPFLPQRYALATFFYASQNAVFDNTVDWTGPNESFGWLSETGYCLWAGVVCEENESAETSFDGNANVLQLSLERSNVNGRIPSELAALSALQILQLNTNRMRGTMPPELGRLLELREFRVKSNDLTGLLPDEYSNLRNLQVLEAQFNDLTGNVPESWGTSLESLSNLRLYMNSLTGRVPDGLCDLEALRILVTDCNSDNGGTVECDCCTTCYPKDS